MKSALSGPITTPANTWTGAKPTRDSPGSSDSPGFSTGHGAAVPVPAIVPVLARGTGRQSRFQRGSPGSSVVVPVPARGTEPPASGVDPVGMSHSAPAHLLRKAQVCNLAHLCYNNRATRAFVGNPCRIFFRTLKIEYSRDVCW